MRSIIASFLSYILLISSIASAQAPAPQAPAPQVPSAQEPKPQQLQAQEVLPKAADPSLQPWKSEPWFPKPSYFRKHFYTPPSRVELQPMSKIEDFVVEGKLELSLKNFLDLVMTNNTDIQLQKLALETPKNAITRAYGIFDPRATASFNSSRRVSASTSVLEGGDTVSSLTQPLRLTYDQTLESGTQYSIGFDGTKSATSNSFSTFNPSITTGLNFQIQQPLLRNRGFAINRMNITIARVNLRTSEYRQEDQVMNIVVQAENAYWTAIGARENVRVREQALELAAKSLERSETELKLGAISELEIYQPRADYTAAQLSLAQAKYQVTQAEDALRRQIGADFDPRYRTMPIVLTESVEVPANDIKFDNEALVTKALARRPDLRATRQALDVDELRLKQASNALRPDLSLTGSYSSSGRGGTFYERNDPFDRNLVTNIIPGGIGDSLNQLFAFNLPTYGFGLTLRFPIKDRAGAANLADALVARKQDQLTIRNSEQNARLQVLNAITNVESSLRSVELAKTLRDVAQQQADADQKRYDLGTIIMFFLLQSQQRLADAEARLVTESINYRRNMIQLLRQTGTLLDERGIVVQ